MKINFVQQHLETEEHLVTLGYQLKQSRVVMKDIYKNKRFYLTSGKLRPHV